METDGRVEKQSTVFPHVLAKRLGAFCTVPTGFTAVNPQTTKPDIFICYRHRYLLSCFGGTHACDRLRLNRASDHVVRDSSDLVGPLLADGCKQSEGTAAMTSKFRSISPYGSVGLFALPAFLLFLNLASAQVSRTEGQIQPESEEGVPVTDPLLKAKCGSCHTSDDRGNMLRLSWERATPEAWERALKRMIVLAGLDLTPSEATHIIQYLSTNHGLAPESAAFTSQPTFRIG